MRYKQTRKRRRKSSRKKRTMRGGTGFSEGFITSYNKFLDGMAKKIGIPLPVFMKALNSPGHLETQRDTTILGDVIDLQRYISVLVNLGLTSPEISPFTPFEQSVWEKIQSDANTMLKKRKEEKLKIDNEMKVMEKKFSHDIHGLKPYIDFETALNQGLQRAPGRNVATIWDTITPQGLPAPTVTKFGVPPDDYIKFLENSFPISDGAWDVPEPERGPELMLTGSELTVPEVGVGNRGDVSPPVSSVSSFTGIDEILTTEEAIETAFSTIFMLTEDSKKNLADHLVPLLTSLSATSGTKNPGSGYAFINAYCVKKGFNEGDKNGLVSWFDALCVKSKKDITEMVQKTGAIEYINDLHEKYPDLLYYFDEFDTLTGSKRTTRPGTQRKTEMAGSFIGGGGNKNQQFIEAKYLHETSMWKIINRSSEEDTSGVKGVSMDAAVTMILSDLMAPEVSIFFT